MSDFEKWFVDQDFYTNMRFIHGDKLFDKDGDVYRVLPVQMAFKAWSAQRQSTKDEHIALTQEWHTKGWNARQEEINDLKARLSEVQRVIDVYEDGDIDSLSDFARYVKQALRGEHENSN